MNDFPPTTSQPAPKKNSAMPWVLAFVIGGVVVTLLICGGLVSILVPALGKAREAARRIQSEVMVRQIVTALNVYSVKYQGATPAIGQDWEQLLIDEGDLTTTLESPFAIEGEPSFYYVPGHNLREITQSRVVLVYENPTMIEEVRTGAVGYADGTVMRLPYGEFMETIMGSVLPDGTPYVPHEEE